MFTELWYKYWVPCDILCFIGVKSYQHLFAFSIIQAQLTSIIQLQSVQLSDILFIFISTTYEYAIKFPIYLYSKFC
jgi:hypothetical protein